MKSIFLFFDRYQNVIVHLTAALILLAGLAYTFTLGNSLRYPDAKQYYGVAVHIAAGNGITLDGTTPIALFPPVVSCFHALFIKLGASIVFLRYLNFVALAICVYVIRSILGCIGARSGAPLSALLILGYPVLFYTAGTLYTQTIFTLILLVLIRVTVAPRFSYLHAVSLGVLSTLLILTHATGVFVPPLLVLWLILPKNYAMIGKGIVAALVAIICFTPWWYRNFTVFDRFIPITSHGGDTLYIGNNPNTNLGAWYTYTEEDYFLEAKNIPDEEKNAYYLRKTVEFWTEHTGDAIKLYGVKLLDHFNFRNNLAISRENSTLRDTVMFVTYYPLLLCLLLRLLFAFRFPLLRVEKLLLAIYLVSALFHALFLPRIRFRLPYDTVLITHIGIMFALVRESLFGQENPDVRDQHSGVDVKQRREEITIFPLARN